MTLSLDSTLQARLDGIDRQPALEILSSEFQATIPFQGNSFGIAGSSAFQPHVISHSTGRLAQVYGGDNGEVQWMYTDTERNQWTTIEIGALIGGTEEVEYICSVELPNGNIGLVMITNTLGNRSLRQATVSVTGAVVAGTSTIEDLNDSYTWTAPYVALLDSGDYYLVYVRKDTGTPAYAIYARTASTWGSWGSASDITPAGVNTARDIDNPSLFETAEGDLFLLFNHVTAVQDVVTIANIFSSISTDNGASWGTATARTNYTQFGSSGLDPIMVQKSNGTVWLIFYENKRVLHMDSTGTGFVSCTGCSYSEQMGVKDIHLDYANGKIIVAFGNSQWGNKCIGGVAVVDKNTWAIDKIYYTNSSPALNDIFCKSHVWNNKMIHGDGKYLALGINAGNGHTVVAVIDHTADSVTHYMIDDLSMTYNGLTDGLPAWNLPRNVEHNSNARYGFLGIGLQCIRVDAARGRLYMGWDGGYHRGNEGYFFSYIDLTAAPDGEGFYTMTWLTSETTGTGSWPNRARTQTEYGWQFELDTDRGYIVASGPSGALVGNVAWNGSILVFLEGDGCPIVKHYDKFVNNSAPIWGFTSFVLYNGAVYGNVSYYAQYPHTDQRGLCKIDYTTDTITYYRPTFATADNYSLQGYAVDEDNARIYIACPWGMARFDTVSGAWSIFNNETMPGFVRNNESDSMGFVQFDPVTRDIIGGAWNDYVSNYLSGINMFNESGAYNQLQYIMADKAASWVWGSQLDLSYYNTEMQPTAVIDPADVLWVMWNHQDFENAQNVLYWGNDLGDIELLNDITSQVILNWRLKRVNTLDFRLGNGHLYDPQNLLSTKNVVGQKGRKVHVRLGEEIGGYTYWVNQGTFIVDSGSMSYERGGDPLLSLSCTGMTGIWRQQQISVTTLYSGQGPDDVIRDIIDDHTQWLNSDYDIPVFNAEHDIYYQWLDKTIWNVVEEICDHFFYAMFEDTDGVFRPRRVHLTQAVDHEYTDQIQLLQFTPDDNYSDYTNRVRVIGESNDYTEVIHAEEMITSRGGTVGWWVKKTTETIYFSEDQERQCRNPRLEIIHSPKEYGLLLDQLSSGKGGIKIDYIDPYERYIIVEIQIPDLTAALIGAIVAMVIVAAAATWCGASLFSTCGPYIWATALAAALVFYILAAMANYQYEVHARPLGRVKTTIQYEANDEEFQLKLNGEIVTEEITDPLCNTVAECRRVAEGNLDLIKAQRRRLRFRKLTHLQDELLDKLKVYHPYSNEPMEILVVGLKRVYEKRRGVFDEIDGWRYIA